MELKVPKSSKKSKDSNLARIKSLELIDHFFQTRVTKLPEADSVIIAACSKDIKVRMRAQFVILFYARLNLSINSSHFSSKPAYSTYLATCISFAQFNEIKIESVILPYDHKVWNKLYDEFNKMLASKYFIPMVRKTSQEIRANTKEKNKGRLLDITQDNYEHAKEILEASIQGAELHGNWDDNNFVIRVLGEIVKMKDISNINTLLGYHRKRFKVWDFYDELQIEPRK